MDDSAGGMVELFASDLLRDFQNGIAGEAGVEGGDDREWALDGGQMNPFGVRFRL